jgi:hypothetical protein
MEFTTGTVALFESLLLNYQLSARDQNFEAMAVRISNAKQELVQYHQFQQQQAEQEAAAAATEEPKEGSKKKEPQKG